MYINKMNTNKARSKMKKIITAIALATAISTTAQADWKTTTKVDDFDGTKTVLNSKVGSESSYFYIRESNGETDLFFGGRDSHICGDKRGQVAFLYKFDDDQIYYSRANLSTDKSALFLDLGKEEPHKWKYPTPTHPDLTMSEFIAKAKGSQTFTIRYHDTCGTQNTYKF